MKGSAGLVTIFNRGRKNGRGNQCSCRRVAVAGGLWHIILKMQSTLHWCVRPRGFWSSYSSVMCHSSLVFMSVPFLLWLALAFAIERIAAGIGNAKSSQ